MTSLSNGIQIQNEAVETAGDPREAASPDHVFDRLTPDQSAQFSEAQLDAPNADSSEVRNDPSIGGDVPVGVVFVGRFIDSSECHRS